MTQRLYFQDSLQALQGSGESELYKTSQADREGRERGKNFRFGFFDQGRKAQADVWFRGDSEKSAKHREPRGQGFQV